jgi:hypothetical protein
MNRNREAAIGLAAALIAAVTLLTECVRGQRQAPPAPRSRPNIVLILTDDLDRNLGTIDKMPKLKEDLAGTGITFPNMFVSESLCCPSTFAVHSQSPGVRQQRA